MTYRFAPWFLALATSCVAGTGPAWEELPANPFYEVWGHLAVYDSLADRMLVFGGQGQRGQTNQVLAFDLETEVWRELETINAPSPRSDLAGFFDASRNRLVIVGGRVGFADSVAEVWALDLASRIWSQLPTGPSARHDIAAATDGHRAWIFGGAGQLFQSLEDLWELNLETDTWTELPNGGVHPVARTSMALGYFDGSLYVHGGHDVANVTRDTWRYDLAEQRWHQLPLAWGTIAGAHFGHAIDPECGHMLLSGGDNLDNFAVAHSNIVLLRGAPASARINASVLPPARDHASLIIDTARRRMILYGGGRLGDGLGTLNDIWALQLPECL